MIFARAIRSKKIQRSRIMREELKKEMVELNKLPVEQQVRLLKERCDAAVRKAVRKMNS